MMQLIKENISKFKIQDYLGKNFTCDCGREHTVEIENVIIENGAINKMPEVLKLLHYNKVFLVADTNTYKAAGEQVENVIIGNGFELKKHVYKRDDDLVPDEVTIGEFIINYYNDADVIVAVGSGVLNDLCKFMSYKLNTPYIIVATAPSMDGYASIGSALSIENLKTTVSGEVPKAIIGDVDVLKDAPLDMIRAGFGDMVGKYSAINDWKLGKMVNDEYYCDYVSGMVMHSLKKCMETAEGLENRENEAIRNLMEGLVLTGIAMSFTGNSRPASGSEHHLSHFVEMMYLFDKKQAPPHGVKVGFNTIVMNYIRQRLSESNPDINEVLKKASSFNKDKWTDDVKRLFRQAAPGVIHLNENEGINSYDKRVERVKRIIDNWEEFASLLKEVPHHEEIREILKRIGAPISLKELNVDKETIINGLVYAKEVRKRYTVLQLAWDLGLLDDIATEMESSFFNE